MTTNERYKDQEIQHIRCPRLKGWHWKTAAARNPDDNNEDDFCSYGF